MALAFERQSATFWLSIQPLGSPYIAVSMHWWWAFEWLKCVCGYLLDSSTCTTSTLQWSFLKISIGLGPSSLSASYWRAIFSIASGSTTTNTIPCSKPIWSNMVCLGVVCPTLRYFWATRPSWSWATQSCRSSWWWLSFLAPLILGLLLFEWVSLMIGVCLLLDASMALNLYITLVQASEPSFPFCRSG